MTEKKVLVYGALNLDHVYSVDHFAGPGELKNLRGSFIMKPEAEGRELAS